MRFYTVTNPEITRIYRICYPLGVKTVTQQWLDQINSPLALAIWYMDDGSMSKSAVNISTNKFTLEEQLLLQQRLQKQWSVRAKISEDCRGRGYFLRLNAKDRDVFFNLIKQYIIPSMQYKLLASLEPVPCCICGQMVFPNRAVLTAKKHVVCSNKECKRKLIKLNRGWKAKEKKHCVTCGAEFMPIQQKTIACSRPCYHTYKLQYKKLKRSQNKKPKAAIQCLQCQKQFIPINGHQKLCSIECRKARKLLYQQKYNLKKKVN